MRFGMARGVLADRDSLPGVLARKDLSVTGRLRGPEPHQRHPDGAVAQRLRRRLQRAVRVVGAGRDAGPLPGGAVPRPALPGAHRR